MDIKKYLIKYRNNFIYNINYKIVMLGKNIYTNVVFFKVLLIPINLSESRKRIYILELLEVDKNEKKDP